MSTAKKILFALGAILVIVIIVVLILFVLGRSSDPVEQTTPSTPSFPGSSGSSGSSGGSIPGGAGPAVVGEPEGTGGEVTTTTALPIRKIAEGPVASATTFGTENGVNLTVRYIEELTGHVYDYRVISSQVTPVSNAAVPRVRGASWGNLGQSILLRYADANSIKSYLAQLPANAASTALTSLDGSFVEGSVLAIAGGPKGIETTDCAPYLTLPIRENVENDSNEVLRLKQFLRDVEGVTDIEQTGEYDERTVTAVKAFQTKYAEVVLLPAGLTEASGFVGPSTRSQINKLHCQRSQGRVVGGKLAVVKETTNGSSIYSVDMASGAENLIFSSKYKGWDIQWPNKDRLVLSTKPSYTAIGHAYMQNLNAGEREDGTLDKIASGNGLSVSVSPDGKRALYSANNARQYKTTLVDLDTLASRPFLIDTLPKDKCVWSETNASVVYCAAPEADLTGQYPDIWYQGRTTFSDEIYKINTETETVDLVFSPADAATGSLDVIDPVLADEESHLFFTNKKDGSLWAIRIVGI